MRRRSSLSRVLWWFVIAFPLSGIVWYGGGCGGRIAQEQCAIQGMHYCVVADVCCPMTKTCGTGDQDAGGNGCPIGACCPGSGPPKSTATTPEPWPTDEPVPQVTSTADPSQHGHIIPTHVEP